MKKTILKELILLAVSMIPIIYILIVWDSLPNEIATHFDLSGKANGFTKKSNIILTVAAIMLTSYLTLLLLQKIDPKNQIKKMGNNLFKIKLVIHLFLSAIFTNLIYMSINSTNDNYMILILSVFLAIIGNYMQTIKPNYFIGLRTPWTLQNDIIWKKTHRITGILLMVLGSISTLAFFLFPMNITRTVFYISLFISLGLPYLYSYLLYKQKNKTKA